MIMYDIWDAAAGASHAAQRKPFEEALKSLCERKRYGSYAKSSWTSL